MSRREKKPQRIIGSSDSWNKPPDWKSGGLKRGNEDTGESSTSSKRRKLPVERDDELFNALHDEYRDFLYSSIMRSINANEDVKNPKQSILSAARVPKEMITRAERRINAEASEIERLINRKRKDKTGFERWIEFVNDNFDNFALNLRHDLKEKGKEKLASVDIADQTDVISSSKAVTSSEEPPLKCFSCSLTPLLRPDLPPGIKQGFIDCIRNTLISSTDYIYEFSLQMLKSVLVFKKSTFDMDENNNVTLKPKNGPLVSDILPEIRQEKYSALYLPPPLDHKLC